MMRRLAPALLVLASFTTASAHEVCGARKDLIETLGRDYGETVRFEGITRKGEYMEVLASDKNGTYTILATRPDGQTCIKDSGIGNTKKNFDWAPTLDH